MPRSEIFDGLVSGPRDSMETKAITWPALGLGTGTGESRTSPELCYCSLGSDLGVSPFTFLGSTFHLTEFSKRAKLLRSTIGKKATETKQSRVMGS